MNDKIRTKVLNPLTKRLVFEDGAVYKKALIKFANQNKASLEANAGLLNAGFTNDVVILEILLYTNYYDLIGLSTINKQFAQLCQLPYFWEQKLFNEFNIKSQISNLKQVYQTHLNTFDVSNLKECVMKLYNYAKFLDNNTINTDMSKEKIYFWNWCLGRKTYHFAVNQPAIGLHCKSDVAATILLFLIQIVSFNVKHLKVKLKLLGHNVNLVSVLDMIQEEFKTDGHTYVLSDIVSGPITTTYDNYYRVSVMINELSYSVYLCDVANVGDRIDRWLLDD